MDGNVYDEAISMAITAAADEIERANRKWGQDFDDKNTLNDWATYINIYVARAAEMANRGNIEAQYEALIKAAGLALNAAAHVGAMPPRHYDPKAKE